MRDYELTVLVVPTVSEKELDKEVKTLSDLLSKGGAKIKSKTDPAKKPMAYEINKFREAYYLFVDLALEPASVSTLEQKLRLEDTILRYLLVKKG